MLMQPIATAAPAPEVYETEEIVSDTGSGTAPLTEVIRFKIGGSVTSAQALEAWNGYVAAVAQYACSGATSGTSANLEEQLFAGFIGWEGLEVCRSDLSAGTS